MRQSSSTTQDPGTYQGEPLRLPHIELPPWLALILAVATIVGGLVFVGNLALLAARAIFDNTYYAPNPVSGNGAEPSRPAEERGPMAVLAHLLRLFRGTMVRGSRRRETRRAPKPEAKEPGLHFVTAPSPRRPCRGGLAFFEQPGFRGGQHLPAGRLRGLPLF